MISKGGRGLVFLIGAPRSGTTLLSLILGKAPGVLAPPEPWIGLPIARLLSSQPALHQEASDIALASQAVRETFGTPTLRQIGSTALVGAYNSLLSRTPGAQRLIDKTPRYYKIAPLLAELLPRARFVLISRDPLDIASSHKDRWQIDLLSLASPAGLCDTSFDVLLAANRIARLRDQLGTRAHWIRYEDLVQSPAREVAALCGFLDITFGPELLDYRRDNASASDQERSAFGDREVWRRDRVDQSAVGRWASVLSDPEVALVCAALGPECFENLGYPNPKPHLDDAILRERLEAALDASLASPGGTPEQLGSGETSALLGRLFRSEQAREAAEAGRRIWEASCREAEQERGEERKAREREEVAKEKWESVCREAEQQREEWQRLCAEAEAGRDAERAARQSEADARARWERLCRDAEQQREEWQRLCAEAEAGRDAERAARQSEADARARWERLCRDAEQQREEWQRLCAEAEAGRDAERAARQSEADARARWERLCHEAEQQRDELSIWRHRLATLWPWMDAVAGSDGSSRPRISIVTPSFNQARWIGATIESVLAQGYPDFEHIVVDGGSTDETAVVVARYPHVRFLSEPDQGQAHAINKGVLLATGDIVAYLNSDDVYRPGAFDLAADLLGASGEADVIVGDCDYIDEQGETIGHLSARLEHPRDLLRYWGWDQTHCVPQQAVFWRRGLLAEIGLFDPSLQYTMDYEMWLRMFSRGRFVVRSQTLSGFRMQSESKTVSSTWKMYLEERRSARRHWPRWWRPERWQLEVVSARHVGRKLLDVAEHEALAKRQRRHPLRLLGTALRHWPLLLLDPRMALTAASAAASGGPAQSLSERIHRGYLHGLWRMRQPRARKA